MADNAAASYGVTRSVAAAQGRRVPRVWQVIRIPVFRIVAASIFLLAWEMVAYLALVDPMFISRPSQIWLQLTRWVQDGTLAMHTSVTLTEAFLGWVLGAAVGIIVGFFLAASRTLDQVFSPYINALNAAPRIALVSLFILWFGLGIASKVAVAFTVVVIIVLVSTNNAAKNVDGDLLILLRSLRASRREMVQKLVLPWCVPFIFGSLRLALGYAMTSAIAGEMIASQSGLGNLIAIASGNLNTAGLFAALAVAVIIAYLATMALTRIETRMLHWRPAAANE